MSTQHAPETLTPSAKMGHELPTAKGDSSPFKRGALVNGFNCLGMILIHVGAVYAFFRGTTWKLVGLAAVSYFIRMFLITGVYHRYFSHRTYRTSRAFQFILAFLGTTATEKGPLWWASMHRNHHRFSDTPQDVHSPRQRGFWYAHMGWFLSPDHEETDWTQVRDLAKFPELRFIDKHYMLGVLFWMLLATVVGGGFDGFLWGYVVSTFFLMHCVYFINSLAHVWGTRRYETADTSRNNFFLALLTLGEGWHNNHHHYMSSCAQGFYWYEIDISYYILKGFEKLGLVWDVRKPPKHIIEGHSCKTSDTV